jgi:hypothetical protein
MKQIGEVLTEQKLKELTIQKLDEKFLEDLRSVMSTEEGRRFFSWIFSRTGFNNVFVKGNSQDFVALGKRVIGADLVFACDSLDIEGIKLRHQAEIEYIILQKCIASEIVNQYRKGEK